jgi:hypothetical protein
MCNILRVYEIPAENSLLYVILKSVFVCYILALIIDRTLARVHLIMLIRPTFRTYSKL